MPDQKNFCANCGNPLNPGARFCQGCGQPVSAGPSPGYAPFSPLSPSAAPSRRIGNGTRWFIPWIISGLMLVAVGGVLGGYYWGKSSDSPSPPSHVQEVPPGLPEPSNAPDLAQEFVPLPPPPAPEQTPSSSEPGSGWPWTSQRLVTSADLAALSPWELELMRNEIFARHGWVFQRDDLRAYFENQPWYQARGALANREAANRLVDKEITHLERRNISAILEYEGKFGKRPPDLPGQAVYSPWSWTSRRPVTRADLAPLSRRELELMRNEIFARHGWVFERDDLRAHFANQPWYRPKGTLANRAAANRLADKTIAPLERQNIKVILEYESKFQRIP
jgi:hypothetical protein